MLTLKVPVESYSRKASYALN